MVSIVCAMLPSLIRAFDSSVVGMVNFNIVRMFALLLSISRRVLPCSMRPGGHENTPHAHEKDRGAYRELNSGPLGFPTSRAGAPTEGERACV
jgi:hypothetical protein